MNSIIREHHHRLSPKLYRGYVTVSFTCCMKDRAPVFIHREIFNEFSKILLTEAAHHQCNVLAYIFMPDHCHILLQGISDTADVLRAILLFKQRTGFWFSGHEKDVHWQKDFYDHILQTDEEITKHIRYILDNPIRKGIVEDWKTYPLKGSSI